MARKGRKPLATGHVERLSGSELAKLRLTTLLQTLRGELTVPQACARLGIGESRFHALRNEWLQEALQLLEPRPLGRPRQATAATENPPWVAALEAENEELRQQLAAAEVRRELAEILPHVVAQRGQEALKKNAASRAGRRRKRR
jgi:hypothetical protein